MKVELKIVFLRIFRYVPYFNSFFVDTTEHCGWVWWPTDVKNWFLFKILLVRRQKKLIV